MLIFAFCQDSPLAGERRKLHFAAHMDYLRSVMPGIRLAAPLATADGAVVSQGERLIASLFVLEYPSLEAASDSMAADPYTSQDIWRCVSLFTVSDARGTWHSEPGAAKRLYAVLSTADDAGLLEGPTLFGARLRLQKSLGDAALARPWQSVIVFTTDSLGDAQARVAAPEQVWAIPMTAGSWPAPTPL
jgi:uncharacterized protein YciI